MTRNNCAGCKHDLGGSCCAVNCEGECREGGGFEHWEARTRFADVIDIGCYADSYMMGRGFTARRTEVSDYEVGWE